jgi:hypothetical protein
MQSKRVTFSNSSNNNNDLVNSPNFQVRSYYNNRTPRLPSVTARVTLNNDQNNNEPIVNNGTLLIHERMLIDTETVDFEMTSLNQFETNSKIFQQ